MINLAVVFGGNSCEADVSLITAMQTIAAIDSNKYKVFPLYIKGDKFLYSSKYTKIACFNKDGNVTPIEACFCGRELFLRKKKKLKKLVSIDCVLLCTHGGTGENGGIQGYFDICGIPYTSSGVLASAIGMDKSTAKKIFANLKLPQVPYIEFLESEYSENSDKVIRATIKKLGLPIIVKPCNQGSSIGIKIAETEDELKFAIEVALQFSSKIICEKALTSCVELNCACVAKCQDVFVSEVEKPVKHEKILSFENKYIGGKMSGGERELPAKISDEQANEIKSITKTVYEKLACEGVVRVDFLLSDEGKVFLNEINTIPGSLAFYLFKNCGLSQSGLIDALIENALYKFEHNKKYITTYRSNILFSNNFGAGKGK